MHHESHMVFALEKRMNEQGLWEAGFEVIIRGGNPWLPLEDEIDLFE